MSETVFTLSGDFIELSKLLKASGLCDSGGAAKVAILQSEVKVDGEVETRKGRKIRRGQRVEFLGHVIVVG